MKILFVTAHIFLPQMYGGLQNSTNQLCRHLMQRGHKVAVLAGLMPDGIFGFFSRIKMQLNKYLSGCKVSRDNYPGYPVWRTWHPWEVVGHVTATEKPDVIVVMAMRQVRMALAARETGTPLLMQLQDVEFNQHGGSFAELGHVACVANSQFTSQKYREAFGVDPLVIYPFISKEKYKTDTRRRNITLINPHPKKGSGIALEIARRCPDIPFVFVEAWPLADVLREELHERLKMLPNVKLLPPQKDMRAIYGECKILLAPSVWEEAYGRVATEAQVSGIPVVASNRGGLPEAVGNGGVLLDPQGPIVDWVAVIRRLWDDEEHYRAMSEAALAYSQRPEVNLEHQIDLWEQALKKAAAVGNEH